MNDRLVLFPGLHDAILSSRGLLLVSHDCSQFVVCNSPKKIGRGFVPTRLPYCRMVHHSGLCDFAEFYEGLWTGVRVVLDFQNGSFRQRIPLHYLLCALLHFLVCDYHLLYLDCASFRRSLFGDAR